MDFQFGYLLTSLIAGFLTILSPCVLPLLPIVISGSSDSSKSFFKPLRIIISLIISIIVFSILLKASTSLLGVPTFVWQYISGGILILFGILTLMHTFWAKISRKINSQKAHSLLNKGLKRQDFIGDFFIGLALGPVFSSCSPTYLAIVGHILPVSWLIGSVYLLTFVFGLGIVLILIAIFGYKLVAKLNVLSKPDGWFKRIIAIVFMLVGLSIIMGWDKDAEAYLLDRGLYNWLYVLEDKLPASEPEF